MANRFFDTFFKHLEESIGIWLYLIKEMYNAFSGYRP